MSPEDDEVTDPGADEAPEPRLAEVPEPGIAEVREVDAPVRPDRRDLALVVSAILAGLALRVYVLATSLGPVDADEAVVGLMARHILDGEHSTFFWGQEVGGTPQAYLVAVSIKLFGTSFFSLRLPTVLLSIANTVLVWRIATRLVPSRQAIAAALVMWVWPPMLLWLSVRELLFYTPTVTLGLATWLLVLRTTERPDRVDEWGAVGVLLGLGWWMSPNIVYFAFPIGVWFLWTGALRRAGPRPLVALPGLAVAVWPWLRYNLAHDWASMRHPPLSQANSPVESVRFLAESALPGALGLRQPYLGAWSSPLAQWVVYPVAIGLLGWAAWRALRARGLDGVALLAFPVAYAMQPFGALYSNLRYTYCLWPMLALVAARLLRDRRVAAGALAALTLVSVANLHFLQDLTTRDEHPLLLANSLDVGPAVDVLRAEGLTRGYAGYWTAFLVTYLSEEAVIVAPTSFYDRYPAYDAAVSAAERPFWLLPADSYAESVFLDDLRRLGVTERVVDAGPWHIHLPERSVDPAEISPDAKY